jgi:hypothetical protein
MRTESLARLEHPMARQATVSRKAQARFIRSTRMAPVTAAEMQWEHHSAPTRSSLKGASR